jgi:hypothetical protein
VTVWEGGIPGQLSNGKWRLRRVPHAGVGDDMAAWSAWG